MEILAEAVKLFIGNKEILKGLDFHLKPKEFLGIIGPNGSGKSMFLKCLYRVQKPTAGKIELNGRALDELSYRESALQLSVVAQHNFYSFDFSVMEVVLMGRSPHKRLIPVTALVGAIFLVISDGLCRVLIPHTELPIGILIALVGAPAFIYLMVKRTYGFGGQ